MAIDQEQLTAIENHLTKNYWLIQKTTALLIFGAAGFSTIFGAWLAAQNAIKQGAAADATEQIVAMVTKVEAATDELSRVSHGRITPQGFRHSGTADWDCRSVDGDYIITFKTPHENVPSVFVEERDSIQYKWVATDVTKNGFKIKRRRYDVFRDSEVQQETTPPSNVNFCFIAYSVLGSGDPE
ncbi:MAG: hypothetical protein R3C18_00805 [Planctomycetaceae bacterium]